MNKASNIITIKGQPAAVTFEADINAFRGKFLNVNGYCDFVATSIEALYREGESALDEWMADCEEDGIAPFREEEEQKRLTLRVPHHIDSRLTIVARQHSISKNQLIVDVLEREFSAPGFQVRSQVCHLSVIRHHVLQRRCSSDKLFHLPSSSPPESFCLNPHH